MTHAFRVPLSLGLFLFLLPATLHAEQGRTPTGSPSPPPAVSAAELPPDDEPPEPIGEKPRYWYGLPMIALDVLWLGMTGLGRAIDSDETVILSAAGGILNGLAVHTFVYQEDAPFTGLGKGLLSVAIRGSLAGAGCKLGSGCAELSDPALLRLSVGMALGAALDASFLAFKGRKGRALASGVTLYPVASGDSVGAGLAGRF